jgi:hypothetical protein
MESAMGIGFVFFLLAIILGFVVFIIAAIWKVFEKAGQPGWAVIIPIYNYYIMTKIAGKPRYWTLLLLIPLLNVVFLIWMYNMISKSFGKDEGFTVGLVLLGIVFWPILGFGCARYIGPYGNPEAFAQGQQQFDFEQGEFYNTTNN